MFVHYREKFSHVFRQKKRYFYFTAFIHNIRSPRIEQHVFSEKRHTGFVDSRTEISSEQYAMLMQGLYCYPPS